MKERILELLKETEQKHRIKVLLAVESGSRAWGFASQDSDYDVRFIYVHSPDWYFRIERQKDTIDEMYDDRLMDLAGWELKKTLNLMRKTNPSLSDWLHTDLIYYADKDFREQMLKLEQEYYHPVHAMYHFYSMAVKHDERYLGRDGYTLKRFLYYLRGVLACRYIEKHLKHPPVLFPELVAQVVKEEEIRQGIERLLALKQSSKEHDKMLVEASLSEYAMNLGKQYEHTLETFRPDVNVPKDTKSLDDFLMKVVMHRLDWHCVN